MGEDGRGWLIIIAVWGLMGLAVLVGGTILQVVLSKKENKWLGYILPAVSLGQVLPFIGIAGLGVLSSGEPLRDIVYMLDFVLPGLVTPFYLLIVYLICRRKRQESKRLPIAILVGIIVVSIVGYGIIQVDKNNRDKENEALNATPTGYVRQMNDVPRGNIIRLNKQNINTEEDGHAKEKL